MTSEIARRISKPVIFGLAALAVTAVSSRSWAMGARGDLTAARAAQAIDHGTATSAPEIDAGSAATAVALLAGGLALLRHRARR